MGADRFIPNRGCVLGTTLWRGTRRRYEKGGGLKSNIEINKIYKFLIKIKFTLWLMKFTLFFFVWIFDRQHGKGGRRGGILFKYSAKLWISINWKNNQIAFENLQNTIRICVKGTALFLWSPGLYELCRSTHYFHI